MGDTNKSLNLKWISESINDDYKKWNKGDVVIIRAQTGTGKTHFIKNVLIPSMKNNEKMLIIANRVNLKRQLKKDICKMYNLPVKENMDHINKIKNITIMSYQQLANIIYNSQYGDKALDLSGFDYIVCDEAHFFMTDAGFNNKCDLIFYELIRKKHNAIKIFISATLDEIYTAIKNGVESTNGTLKTYSTGNDYSYIECTYFKKINDIVKLIKNDKTDNKWLVFVKSKQDGERMLNKIRNICSCEFITKETDITKSENLNSVVNDSKFLSKVLISTKVLDNGVNIKDEKLKNVVIMSYDKTSFIQMLGRIRIDIKSPSSLNLFIPTFNSSNFSALVGKSYKPKVEMVELFEKDKKEFYKRYDRMNELPSNLFIKHNGVLDLNIFGMVRLHSDFNFLKDINSRLRKDSYAYIKEQLSWLGLESTFNENKLIEDVVDIKTEDRLVTFLKESYTNNERFTKDVFRKKFLKIIDSDESLRIKFNKTDGCNIRSKGLKKINEFLVNNNYDYIIGSKKESINGKRSNYWRVLLNN